MISNVYIFNKFLVVEWQQFAFIYYNFCW